ncbi:Lipoxygenase [Cylindrospermum stagnale PCC 7417]|uniref:Lipoxygenase n=1 Tax=Cylindrospermum stagnale PCC 7417 TaxID=56107 RepID=K9X8P5_9NOST|nr:lipoxygenase family protein [Cylindrospermum stagnale]AFZ28027.1 Lipoxygenase [Cylindrospermum stagnale PCC 7417]
MSQINTEDSSSTLNQKSLILDIVDLLKLLYALVQLSEASAKGFSYQYNYDYVTPLAITNVPQFKIGNITIPLLPKEQFPNLKWVIAVVIRLVVTQLNKSLITQPNFFKSIIAVSLDAIGNEINKPEIQEELSNILLKLKSNLEEINEHQKVDEQLALARLTEQPESITQPSIDEEFEEIDRQLAQFLITNPEKVALDLEKLSEEPRIQNLKEIIKSTAKLAELAKYQVHSLKFFADASSLENYNRQFQAIAKPDISYHFQEDKYFAYMQVAGPNPVMLQQIGQLDSRLPITEDTYSDVANFYGVSDTLNKALAEGRIYLADYTLLDSMVNGTFPQQQKYISAPLALFAVPPNSYRNRSLFPVAISYQQTSISNDWVLFTPLVTDTNADTWMTAKNIVQMADSNYHELISHLGRTHLVVEPFVVATNQLPENHNLRNLLIPHLEGTVLINYGAHTSLIAPGGGVDELLASSIGSDQTLAANGAQSYLFNFNDIAFPNTLTNRGVDDVSKLPTYPYRDDGLLIWEAIESWVREYFSVYYSSNSSVLNDQDLQTWASTLISLEGGRLQNFGDNGQGHIKTLDYLVQAVSTIIFTASAQHAAVNFPQKELMMYTPAFPLARYLPEPTDPQQPENFINGLPPLEQALNQINLLYLLGSVYYTNLGNYSTSAFTDPNVTSALEKFQTNLKDIEQEINQRNSNSKGDRIIPYKFLLPTNIPQSINI